jgi:hypothetical protein
MIRLRQANMLTEEAHMGSLVAVQQPIQDIEQGSWLAGTASKHDEFSSRRSMAEAREALE